MKYLSLILLALVAFIARAEPRELDDKYKSYSADLLEAYDRFQYMSDGGAARCKVKDCLCRVLPPLASSRPDAVKVKRRYSIYFEEGGYTPSPESLGKLSDFLGKHEKTSAVTIASYTDDCGGHSYNVDLARKRAAQIQKVISERGFRSPARTTFRAEASFGHDPASRRVDVIVHTRSRLTTTIDKVQADVYLIDASGSMWKGWKEWSEIVSVSFKPGARVYLSKTISCQAGSRMDSVSPGGGTEIWYSYWKVLDFMKPGETLAVISDFQSDIPLTRREASVIEQKVSAKKVKVIAISL